MSWSRRGVLGALALSGCAPLGRFPFDVGASSQGPIEVRFFSVGCFLVRYGGASLLTDPFFSHLPLARVVRGPVVTDPAQVDPYLPQLRDVRAVVVGHSHYDHMLDLPYLSGSLAKDAQIYGSTSLVQQLAKSDVQRPMVSLNDVRASAFKRGRWQSAGGGRMRVLAIRSGHPDNIDGIHLFQKRVTEPVREAPTKAHDYQEGETLAFLVDWLDRGRIAARVYVQTSSRGLPDGLFPKSIRDEAPIDVALLAMDCARAEASGGPSILPWLDARTVFFCHWGDFFRPKHKTPWEGVKVKLPKLKRELPSPPGRDWRFPAWDSVHRVPLRL